MKRRLLWSSSLVLTLLALPAAGVTPLKGLTQADMNIESGQNAQKADAELNRVYGKLMGTMIDDAAREKLKAAQRLWVKFRDAETESEGDDYRGGSIIPLIRNTCFERLTEERTAQLNDRFQP